MSGGPPPGASGGPPSGMSGGPPPGVGGPPGGTGRERPDFTNPIVLDQLGIFVPPGYGQPGYVVQDKRPRQTAIESTLMLIALILVAGRIYARLRIARAFGWDDGLMVIATMVVIALYCVEMYCEWRAGLGLHTADAVIKIGDISVIAPMFGWIFSLIHIVAIGLIKLSILFFCMRLFQTRKSAVAAKVLAGITTAFAITAFFIYMFQCNPPSGYWIQGGGLKAVAAKTKAAKCLDKHAIHYFTSIGNGVLDVAVWVLPFPALLKLQANRKEKAGIMAIFVIGGVACIASLIRPSSVAGISSERDPPFYAADFALLAMVEVELGIIGACIPAWKILIAKWKPEWFGTLGSRFTDKSSSKNSSGLGSGKHHRKLSSKRKGSTTESTEEFGPDVYPMEHKYAGNKNHSVVVSGEANNREPLGNGVVVTHEYDLQSRQREKPTYSNNV